MIGSRIDVITCSPILFSSAGGTGEAAVPLKIGMLLPPSLSVGLGSWLWAHQLGAGGCWWVLGGPSACVGHGAAHGHLPGKETHPASHVALGFMGSRSACRAPRLHPASWDWEEKQEERQDGG